MLPSYHEWNILPPAFVLPGEQPVSHSTLSLMQGTVDLLILKALQNGPGHGYTVSRFVRERTDGVLQMEDAALYQALHRLEDKGWIASEWGLSENNRRAEMLQPHRGGEASAPRGNLGLHALCGGHLQSDRNDLRNSHETSWRQATVFLLFSDS